jgi:hypothetical protein
MEQPEWRFCEKCHAMFFDGRPDKGRCPVGGGHLASGSGFMFMLPHDVPEAANAQPEWRFCEKCHEMFFNGRPDKGTCPAGGGHSASRSGFVFVLPHDIRFTLELRANPDNLQINPELVIIGRGFTTNGRFHYTILNWPKVQPINNQGSLDVNGSFERTESREFASIRIGVDMPDIQVTAVDEATGRSITARVSSEPFIARFG